MPALHDLERGLMNNSDTKRLTQVSIRNDRILLLSLSLLLLLISNYQIDEQL